MRDGDGRVGRQQQLRDGLAHEQRTPNHQSVGARNIAQRVLDQHHHAQRRAGDEPAPAAREQACTCRRQSIHILGRIDGVEHGLLAHLRRRWKLDQNSVYGRIVIERANARQYLGFARRLRQTEFERVEPAFARIVSLAADIDVARRIVAHQHDSEARYDAVVTHKLRRFGCDTRPQAGCECLAVDDSCRHVFSPNASSAAASTIPSPAICNVFKRADTPFTIAILDRATAKLFASSEINAAFALPDSGAAATRALRKVAPSELCIQPSTASRPPLGVRRTAKRMPCSVIRKRFSTTPIERAP
jgi:hypothetical protein